MAVRGEDVIRRLYVDKQRPVDDIAALLGVGATSVRRHLAEMGIARRTPWATASQPSRIAAAENDDYIRRRYGEDRVSGAVIARELGCGETSVYDQLDRLGIPRRQPARRIELDGDWLRQRYVEEGQTIAAIAREVGCSDVPIRRELGRHGISLRAN